MTSVPWGLIRAPELRARFFEIESALSVAAYQQTGEGGITLPLVHPIVCPLVDFPLAFCQAQNAVREGFEPSVAFWATAL